MKKISCQLSPFSHKYGETRVRTKFKFVSKKKEIRSRLGKRANQDSPWKTQREQILAEFRTEIQKHELQAESDKRSIQALTGIIDSQRMEIDHTITVVTNQLLLEEELSEQNRALRETRIRNMRDMEESQKSHVLKVKELSRRKLTEDQNTTGELRAKIQELQKEINCMNDSRNFQVAEAVRSGPSHGPSQPALLPPYRGPGGLLSRSLGVPSRREGPPSIWDTHGFSGNVFADPIASSTEPYPQELNPWSSRREEPIHSSMVEKSERRTQDQDLKCQIQERLLRHLNQEDSILGFLT